MGKLEILDLLLDHKTKVVSFNLHETLVLRPVLKLPHFFRVVGKRTSFGDYQFMRMRMAAERMALADKARTHKEKDVTLDEIYLCFSRLFDIENEDLKILQAQELTVDLDLTYPRKFMKEIYAAVLEAGKEIIITAQTYFPKQHIEQVLDKNGYTGYSKLYLSSNEGFSQKTGRLYYKVCADYHQKGIAPGEIVHVGSGEGIDFARPKAVGMQAALVPSPRTLFYRDSRLSALQKYTTLWDDNELLYAVIANRLFDDPFAEAPADTLFGGRPANVGLVLFAPLLLAFVKWMMDDAVKENLKLVLFALRDGFLPIRIFNMLQACYDRAPESKTVECSTAMRMCYAAKEKNGFFRFFFERPPMPEMAIKDFIRNRLLVEDENEAAEIFQIFKSYGYNTIHSKIGTFQRDFSLLKKLEPYFIRHALDNANQIDSYISHVLEGHEGRIGIFDVGYRGRVGQHFKEFYNRDNICYNIMVRSHFDIPETDGFTVKAYSRHGNCLWLDTVILHALCEDVINSHEGSAITVRDNGNDTFSVIRQPNDHPHLSDIADAQMEILNYCEEFIEIFSSEIQGLFFDGEALKSSVVDFLENPGMQDAELIKDFKVITNAYHSSEPQDLYQLWYKNKVEGLSRKEIKSQMLDPNNVERTWEGYKRNYDECMENLPKFEYNGIAPIIFLGSIDIFQQVFCAPFLNKVAASIKDIPFILLSDAGVLLPHIEASVFFDRIIAPVMFAETKILTDQVAVDEKIMSEIASTPYLRVSVDRMIEVNPHAGEGYSESVMYYAKMYYQKIIDTYKPAKLFVWSQYYSTHLIAVEVGKENNVEVGFIESGQLPGTLTLDKCGQVGMSSAATQYRRFRELEMTQEEISRTDEIIAWMKMSGNNRFLEPLYYDITALKSRLNPNQPTIVLFGERESDCGIIPYTKASKEQVSPVYSSMLDALEHFAALARVNKWNLLYKPHPGTARMPGAKSGNLEASLPDNVIYTGQADLNEIIDLADVVAANVTSASYVALVRDKPVVIFGYTTLRGKNCTYEAFDRDVVEQALKDALENGFTESQSQMFRLHVAQMLKYCLYDDMTARDIRYGRSAEECAEYLKSDKLYPWEI